VNEYKLGEQLSTSLNSKNIHRNLGGRNLYGKWFGDGINCEVLRLDAKGWQKGKVRIELKVSLEFCPDETEISQLESPLDDIRQMIKKDSQQDNL
jgi:hypothetical protein